MSTRSKDYERLLRDPRWQKRRLEFMSAKGWKCEICGDEREELHVHHVGYDDGLMPWDYEDSRMECLCDTCHTLRHLDHNKVSGYVFKSQHITDRMARVEAVEIEVAQLRVHIAHLNRNLRESAAGDRSAT